MNEKFLSEVYLPPTFYHLPVTPAHNSVDLTSWLLALLFVALWLLSVVRYFAVNPNL